MTTLLAWRNLVNDPIRFAVTLIGIIFSVTLISIQSGLLIGFSQTSSALVDRSTADIWLVARGTKNVDQSVTINEKYIYKALSVPGVANAARAIVRFVIWRKPDGGTEMVIIVGTDPNEGMIKPWNVVAGNARDLGEPGAVMIDQLYEKKLGFTGIGQETEISSRKARIVGLTNGIRTFTQSPYVFTSYNNALKYTDVPDGSANYVMIKAAPGVSVDALKQALAAAVPDVEVLTTEEFSGKTRNYWIFTTGAGASLALGAILGAIVGIVIVAQTLYGATVERMPEYATLSAIGAAQGYLNKIVIKQGLIAGLVGACLALTLSIMLVNYLGRGAAAMILTVPALAIIGASAVAMSVLSSLLAVRKLGKIDPTSVFR